MEDNLKKKTIGAVLFSSLGFLINTIVQMIIGVILARLLSPHDYGLLGMTIIFMTISQIFIDGGLYNALIREKEVNDNDYSTVFYYNLILSVLLYMILFTFAKLVGDFFKEPLLVGIIRIIGLDLILGSFGLVQRTILVRKLDFKTQTIIGVIAAVISGILAIYFAFIGYGVWALVIQRLSQTGITSMLFMLNNRWIPLFTFDKKSFEKLFGFGWKMLLTNILITIYRNVNNLIIGKFYSVNQLGYYTNSLQLSEQVSLSVMTPIQKVSYPVLSQLNDDTEKFKNSFKKIIKSVSFITFPIIFGLTAIANQLISIMFGPKWIEMIPYFQILCTAAITTPHIMLNYNIVLAKGRSDIALKVDIINIIIGLISIGLIVLLKMGIFGLLWIRILTGILAFLIVTHYSSRFIIYPVKEQIKDVVPIFILSITMGLIVYKLGLILHYTDATEVFIQIILGIVIYILLCIIFKIKEFYMILDIIKKLRTREKKDKND